MDIEIFIWIKVNEYYLPNIHLEKSRRWLPTIVLFTRLVSGDPLKLYFGTSVLTFQTFDPCKFSEYFELERIEISFLFQRTFLDCFVTG